MEVVSADETYEDFQEKILEWLEAGVRAAVVANPRQRVVTVYRSLTEIIVLTEDDTLEIPEIIPGWRMLMDARSSAFRLLPKAQQAKA